MRKQRQISSHCTELMNFSQLLGYSAITYRRHNEPATRQILKMLINACHSLGLTTRLVNSKLGDHSFLSGNTVDRVRKLAGTFIEGTQSRLGYQDWIRSCTVDLGSKTSQLGVGFSQSKVQLPMNLSMAKATEDF